MRKEKLWDIYVKKNPSFVGKNNIVITPAGLKKLFDTTYDAAFEEGKETAYDEVVSDGVDAKNQQKTSSSSTKNFGDLFEDIFRKK